MMHRLFTLVILLLAHSICTSLSLADRLTTESLWDLGRIGDVAISPDGKQLAFLITNYDLEENTGHTSLKLLSLGESEVGHANVSTSKGFGTAMVAPQSAIVLKNMKGLSSLNWIQRPEGSRLIYVATTEGENGTPQAFMLDTSNEKAIQLTTVANGISNLKVSPSGNAIAFTVDVKMDSTVTDLYKDLPKANARIIDSLLYRHWNAWHDYAYSHVFVAHFDASGVLGEPVDLMDTLKADCPVPPFGGAEQFEFSPDGKELALTLKLVNNPAESTDTSIFLVSSRGGSLKNITPGMPGYDMEPRYSPDGRFVAFQSMERASFESDRNRIMLYDRASGALREVTSGLDQTTHHATWSEDSRGLYFYSETRGTQQIYHIDIESSRLQQVTQGQFDFTLESIIPGTQNILVRQQNMLRPTELALVNAIDHSLTTITDENGSIYANLELPTVEERYFTATDGKQIHNWVILPPDFDPLSERQWPMLTYCQGGPQGQIGQWFSYRWNFHLMASQGYVVLAVNRRGLPGFGRQWNDQISGDWGGQAMQDILVSTDAMMADPKIDRQRVAAVGASFGGYTVYWLMGNSENRFCSMIAHCGVYNLESMYGSTEELFFVNWDLGGPYWKSAELATKYAEFSPHRFAGNWHTPLLVIHGEKDFRVPVTQGMEAFTAAQVQGVPSRFLYFPEEGHWVSSPQNSVLWGRVFFDWLDKFCKPKVP
ncbi:MAG: S9 family peptidase [Planctomycetales bacterium]|nr:S9 family peptidase [Planctomycetales bacterium]